MSSKRSSLDTHAEWAGRSLEVWDSLVLSRPEERAQLDDSFLPFPLLACMVHVPPAPRAWSKWFAPPGVLWDWAGWGRGVPLSQKQMGNEGQVVFIKLCPPPLLTFPPRLPACMAA
jgi:hypothetical protein